MQTVLSISVFTFHAEFHLRGKLTLTMKSAFIYVHFRYVQTSQLRYCERFSRKHTIDIGRVGRVSRAYHEENRSAATVSYNGTMCT